MYIYIYIRAAAVSKEPELVRKSRLGRGGPTTSSEATDKSRKQFVHRQNNKSPTQLAKIPS